MREKSRPIAKTVDDFIEEANSVGGGRYTIGVSEAGEPVGNIHIDIYFYLVRWIYFDLGTTHVKSLHFLTGNETNIRLNNVHGVELLGERYDGRRTYAVYAGDTNERFVFHLNTLEETN